MILFLSIFSDYHYSNQEARKNYTQSADGDGSYVSRITNATQNVMGKIGGISKITGNIGGIANKFSGNFMKF